MTVTSGALRRAWPVLLLLLVAVAVPWPAPAADASCVAPLLGVDGSAVPPRHPVTLRAGQHVTVHGRFFHHGCDDTGGAETGAFGCSHQEPRDVERPMKHAVLTITQHRHTWRLGTADATGPRSEVHWPVSLPAGLRPGRAVLRADDSVRLPVRIR